MQLTEREACREINHRGFFRVGDRSTVSTGIAFLHLHVRQRSALSRRLKISGKRNLRGRRQDAKHRTWMRNLRTGKIRHFSRPFSRKAGSVRDAGNITLDLEWMVVEAVHLKPCSFVIFPAYRENNSDFPVPTTAPWPAYGGDMRLTPLSGVLLKINNREFFRTYQRTHKEVTMYGISVEQASSCPWS